LSENSKRQTVQKFRKIEPFLPHKRGDGGKKSLGKETEDLRLRGVPSKRWGAAMTVRLSEELPIVGGKVLGWQSKGPPDSR